MRERLKRWWQQLTGTPESPQSQHPASRQRRDSADEHDPTADAKPAAPGELTLADDKPAQRKGQGHGAGFDPYSSDAGYSKPRGWEQIDHD